MLPPDPSHTSSGPSNRHPTMGRMLCVACLCVGNKISRKGTTADGLPADNCESSPNLHRRGMGDLRRMLPA